MAGIQAITQAANELEQENKHAHTIDSPKEQNDYYRDVITSKMATLRASVDAMEPLCDRSIWPVPSYNDILFYV